MNPKKATNPAIKNPFICLEKKDEIRTGEINNRKTPREDEANPTKKEQKTSKIINRYDLKDLIYKKKIINGIIYLVK